MKRILFFLALLIPTFALAEPVVKNAATSKCFRVFVSDSTVTTGAGKTGLAFNTSSLTCYFSEEAQNGATQITMATSTLGTYTSGAFKEVDATNMPGWYEFCVPDASLDGGIGTAVSYRCGGATGMAPMNLRVLLTPPIDMTAYNGTAAVAADTAGYAKVTVKSGTGTGEINLSSGVADANVTKWKGSTAATVDTAGYPVVTIKDGTGAGEIDTNTGAVVAVTTATTCTTASTCTNLTNLPTIPANWITAAGIATDAIGSLEIADGAIDAGALATDTITATKIAADSIGASEIATDAIGSAELADAITVAITGDLTGNVSGSVGSVTGAVGSVTGAVGSVASGGITATSIAADAIGASELAADAVTEIGTGAWATTTRQLTSAQTFDLTGNVTGNLSGSVGSVTGAVGSVTGAVGSVGAGGITAATLAADTITAAKIDSTADTEIKNQVVSALTTDTYAELAACPTATASITDMLQFLFMDSRNKITATSTSQLLKKDDASTTLCTFTTADDGTTFSRGEAS